MPLYAYKKSGVPIYQYYLNLSPWKDVKKLMNMLITFILPRLKLKKELHLR